MKRLDFESLFRALPGPHTILDTDLNFAAANAAYEAATMRREAELLGRNMFEVFPNEGESGRLLRASLERVIATGESDTLAYVHYAIPRPAEKGGGFEHRYWTAVHVPLFDSDGKVIFILQNTVDVTELVRLKEAASFPFRTLPGEIALVQRAQEAEAAYRATLSENEDFKRLFQQAPGMIAVLQGPDHVFTFANDAYQRFVGRRKVIGLPVRQAVPEVEGQGFFEMLDEVYAGGQPKSGEGVRVVLRQAAGEAPQEAFMDFSYQPIRDPGGAVTGIFVQGNDRTESFRSLQRQRLLVDELNHRVKNTLSTVQSIARQSFRSAKAPGSAKATFEARIMALSNAHNILSQRHWEAADLAMLLEQELAIVGPGRFTLDGPSVHLNPKAAIAFAMVFHELGTNAAKYGALATDAGRVLVQWSLPARGSGGPLVLTWQESEGPAASKPLKPGFGTRMLGRIVEGELDGSLDLALRPTGLICRLEVARAEVEEVAGYA